MGKLIVHPDSEEKMNALKTFMKAFNISFEEDQGIYNSEFVAKIQEGLQAKKEEKGLKMDLDDLWK